MGGALAAAIAEGCELKKSVAAQAISTLASIGTEETKKNGKFVIPGLVMIKTRKKPATKKEMFGKTVLVKARPARTVVKAFPAKVLKDEFREALLLLLRPSVLAGQVRGRARLVRQSAQDVRPRFC